MFIEVIVPGPWWHPLTYEFDAPCKRGVRLIVPVRGRERVAFATGVSFETPPPGNFRIQRAKRVLDKSTSLGWELFDTAERIGKHFMCGTGEVLKGFLPGSIISGEPVGPFPDADPPGSDFYEEFCYLPDYMDRTRKYTEMIAEVGRKDGRTIVLFPEKESASMFWKQLPEGLRKSGICWLSNSGTKAMENWERVRIGEVRLVVGSPAAVFAPLPSIANIIVEDEGNPSYRSQRYPFIHARIAAGSRAQLWGAAFVIGGGVPSSRSFFRKPHSCPDSPGKRIVFVDMGRARKISVSGIQYPLPVSDSTLKRTQASISENRNVLWILDRKGYAGAVRCDECGRAMTCSACGLPVRWDDEEGLLRCGFCGSSRPVTEICPFCGGFSLQGVKPGIEGLQKIGENVLGAASPVYAWHADIRKETSTRKKIVKGLSSGGLVVGSRKSLELCDAVPVDLVCWLDADSAVNAPFYDAKSTAFRMIWESAWRGGACASRTVIIQSRVPGTGWQRGLATGWDHFWKTEIAERKDLGLPPWKYLLEIRSLGSKKKQAREFLVSSGIECLDPGPSQDVLWVRCESIAPARKALEPLFRISVSGRGFPRITLWAD